MRVKLCKCFSFRAKLQDEAVVLLRTWRWVAQVADALLQFQSGVSRRNTHPFHPDSLETQRKAAMTHTCQKAPGQLQLQQLTSQCDGSAPSQQSKPSRYESMIQQRCGCCSDTSTVPTNAAPQSLLFLAPLGTSSFCVGHYPSPGSIMHHNPTLQKTSR